MHIYAYLHMYTHIESKFGYNRHYTWRNILKLNGVSEPCQYNGYSMVMLPINNVVVILTTMLAVGVIYMYLIY